MVCELFLLGIIIIYAVKKLLIKVRPLFKCKLFSEYSRADITGNEGCLNEKCPRTTHRIDEICIAFPATHEYHSGCKNLVQRGFYTFLTVSATVKTLTA